MEMGLPRLGVAASGAHYPSSEREQSVGNVRTLPKFISGFRLPVAGRLFLLK